MQEKTAQSGEFKARSGRVVKPQPDGSIRFELAHGYLDRGTAMDAEEYFQTKRDAELDRWRDPLSPDYVVYPITGDRVRVFRERQGTFEDFAREDALVRSSWLPRRVAYAYFEAHPVQEWEDGVYVATTFDPTVSTIYKRRGGEWRNADGFALDNFNPTEAGRKLVRLVPEVTS